MDSATNKASILGIHRELLYDHIYNSQYLLCRDPKIVIGLWGDPLLSVIEIEFLLVYERKGRDIKWVLIYSNKIKLCVVQFNIHIRSKGHTTQ